MSSSIRRASSASRRATSSRAIARSSSSVSRVAHLACPGELGPRLLEPAEGLDDRLEAGELLAEATERVGSVAVSGWASSAWTAS